MSIYIKSANFEDCREICDMQKSAFDDILTRYRDYDTNPACETVEVIQNKFRQPFTKYYFIMNDDEKIGAVRIVEIDDNTRRISPLFILPQFQNCGYAQLAVKCIEGTYKNISRFTLDTIKQEEKLCYLYEKLGYLKTGREEQLHDNMTIVFYEKNLKNSQL